MVTEIAKQLVVQMALQTVDHMLNANAKAADNVGIGVRVSRTYDGVGLSNGRVCEWCLSRECSDLPYAEAKASGVFERHPGCGCVITYDHGDGEVDTINRKDIVVSAVKTATTKALIKRRVNYGLANVTGSAKNRLIAAAVARRLM